MIGGRETINKGTWSRDASCLVVTVTENELPWPSRPQQPSVWLCAPVGVASQNHVLGGVLLHHGQEKEGGPRVQGVAEMCHYGVPKTPGRRQTLDPSGDSITRPTKHALSPLPSPY